MIHVYKAQGPFQYNRKAYSIKSINVADLDAYLKDGWFRTLDEVIGPEKGAYPKTRAPRKSPDSIKKTAPASDR